MTTIKDPGDQFTIEANATSTVVTCGICGDRHKVVFGPLAAVWAAEHECSEVAA